jgi:polysaccharide export outer membrane protein
MDALDEKHKLAIGDRVSFRILEDEEESKLLLVTDSGELELPYLGRFPGVGRDCKELAQAIKVELEKEYYFHATVIVAVDVMAKSRGKVYVNGAVRMPGPQDIPSDEVLTVGKALSRAGGFTEFANKKQVKVTRKPAQPGGEERTYSVNGGDILEKGKTDCDLPLEPDDMIIVTERGFHLR